MLVVRRREEQSHCVNRSKIPQHSCTSLGLSCSLDSCAPVLKIIAYAPPLSLTCYHLKESQFLTNQEAYSTVLGITHNFPLCHQSEWPKWTYHVILLELAYPEQDQV